MNGETIFSRRVLVGWAAAAVVVFAASLFFMGGGQVGDPAAIGPSTFSRSAIGHAGIADVLRRLEIPVVKSRYDSLAQLSRGSVLVIAEPNPDSSSEAAVRTLLKADTILLVLPKWVGIRSDKKPEWLQQVSESNIAAVRWTLRLMIPRGEVTRENVQISWTTNVFNLAPNLLAPTQLVRAEGLVPLIAAEQGILLGELTDRNRKIMILSDPDVISNHGIARAGNAALAVEIFKRLRGPSGVIVFDETVHGFVAGPANPFLLLFRFPFVIATLQAAIAIALLLWATMARFGAPQPAPVALSSGRQGLLLNIAGFIEFTGHRQVIIRRYIQETIRDAARQLHAPVGLAGAQLIGWLQRVGTARGVKIDCGAIAQRASELVDTPRRDLTPLVRLARDIYRWKREIIDGPARNPRAR
jgi:hypothetical protein